MNPFQYVPKYQPQNDTATSKSFPEVLLSDLKALQITHSLGIGLADAIWVLGKRCRGPYEPCAHTECRPVYVCFCSDAAGTSTKYISLRSFALHKDVSLLAKDRHSNLHPLQCHTVVQRNSLVGCFFCFSEYIAQSIGVQVCLFRHLSRTVIFGADLRGHTVDSPYQCL